MIKKIIIVIAIVQSCIPMDAVKEKKSVDSVTIAILAKDKAHTLPLYLSCIEQQTWPSKKTNLYIRTNNNNDKTAQLLRDWIEKIRDRYAEIYFDDTDVKEPVQSYGQHEWNVLRFKVLGKIRQDSVQWAYEHNSHYFVVDCDNFIKPDTLQKLVETDLPIVAPLLHSNHNGGFYSNFHAAINANGYYVDCLEYYLLLNRTIQDLVELPVVHCTYFIQYDVLREMKYDDNSCRYEYVIFSDNARKKGIKQYLDTREVYGFISFAENVKQLEQELLCDSFKCII